MQLKIWKNRETTRKTLEEGKQLGILSKGTQMEFLNENFAKKTLRINRCQRYISLSPRLEHRLVLDQYFGQMKISRNLKYNLFHYNDKLTEPNIHPLM